jgi:flagellar basal-body rod modification protein FlgD
METTTVGTPAPPQTRPPQERAPQERAPNALSSDFETFLRMLTVQMKNQDPLNPIESSDFAVQLATFSGVEQQVRTNELLARLADGTAASGMTGFANWIGQEVRSSGPALFDGAPLTLYPGQGAAPGNATFLVVRDASGLPVARSPFVAGTEPFAWAGVRPDGTPFPAGLYRFDVEEMTGDTVAATRPVDHYARVTEVRSDPAGPTLVLAGGGTVLASGVRAVREAP